MMSDKKKPGGSFLPFKVVILMHILGQDDTNSYNPPSFGLAKVIML